MTATKARVAGALLLGAASFAFGAVLLRMHPAMYWGDGYGRALGRDHVLLDRWLPLLQLVVYGVGRVTSSVDALRIVLGLIGAGAVVAAVALGASLARFSVGVVFAMLLGTNLLFVALSIVPYQEVLFAGLIFVALALHQAPTGQRHGWITAAAFNLACLTRYEGWVLVLVVGLVELAQEASRNGIVKGVRAALALVVRYGFAGIAWFATWLVVGGVARLVGTPTDDPAALGARVHEYIRQCDWQLGNVLLVAAAALGIVASLARRDGRRRHVTILLFVGASVAFILLARPYSLGNLRQTFLPVVVSLLYAAIGIELVVDRVLALVRIDRRGWLNPAITVVVGTLLAIASEPGAARFVTASSDGYGAPYAVGRWFGALPATQRSRAHIALLAPSNTDGMVVALYSGIPEERIVEAGASLANGTTHVVRIERPGEAPTREATLLAAHLDEPATRATATRIDSAVIWTLAPAEARQDRR